MSELINYRWVASEDDVFSPTAFESMKGRTIPMRLDDGGTVAVEVVEIEVQRDMRTVEAILRVAEIPDALRQGL